MKQFRRAFAVCLALLCVLMLCGAFAYADGGLHAWREDGAICVTWNAKGCESDECTLTVYKNGWPGAVICVYAPAGTYTVPAALVSGQGKYSVRLKCGNSCETANVLENDKPAQTPAAQPTAAPTEKPTAAPTAKPTAVPTAKPTAAPTEKPTAAPTQAPSGSASMARAVIDLVNRERASQGLDPLAENASLAEAACVRASEIVQKFSHTRPDGTQWYTVSGLASGENIAMGYSGSDSVMAAWMNSEGHRANILRDGFKTIGVCALNVNGTLYWVQLFGR